MKRKTSVSGPEGAVQCKRSSVSGRHRAPSSQASRHRRSSDRCSEYPAERRPSPCQSPRGWTCRGTACSRTWTSPTAVRRTTCRPEHTHWHGTHTSSMYWTQIYSYALVEYINRFAVDRMDTFFSRCYISWNSRKTWCSFSLFSVKNAKIVQL